MACEKYALYRLFVSPETLSNCSSAEITIQVKQSGLIIPDGTIKVYTQKQTYGLLNTITGVTVSIPMADLTVGEEITFSYESDGITQPVSNSPMIRVVECLTPTIKEPVSLCLNSPLPQPGQFIYSPDSDPLEDNFPDITSVEWEPAVNTYSTNTEGTFDWAIKITFDERPDLILPFKATIIDCNPQPLNSSNSPQVPAQAVLLEDSVIPNAQSYILNMDALEGVFKVTWEDSYSTSITGQAIWGVKVTYQDGTIDYVYLNMMVSPHIGAAQNTPVGRINHQVLQGEPLPDASLAVANMHLLTNVRNVEWASHANTYYMPGNYTWDIIVHYWDGTSDTAPVSVKLVSNPLIPTPEYWKVEYVQGDVTNCPIEGWAEFRILVCYTNNTAILPTDGEMQVRIVLNPSLPPFTGGNLSVPFNILANDINPSTGIEEHGVAEISTNLGQYSPGQPIQVVVYFKSFAFTGFEVAGKTVQTCPT